MKIYLIIPSYLHEGYDSPVGAYSDLQRATTKAEAVAKVRDRTATIEVFEISLDGDEDPKSVAEVTRK